MRCHDSDQVPVSWLFVKRVKKGSREYIQPMINIDEDHIKEFVDSIGGNERQIAFIRLRLLLHELFHYVADLRQDKETKQLNSTALPENEFQRWASVAEERRAWISAFFVSGFRARRHCRRRQNRGRI
jgi:hypothetical protein